MIFTSFIANFYKYKRKCNFTRSLTTTTSGSALKVLFFGTDNFSLPSLQVLHKHSSGPGQLGVVTSFKSPSNCVKLYAEQHKLPLHKWPIQQDLCHSFDLGVVVSFGHLIPARIIQAFPLGMINVHASLLPRWRGAAPIIYALMNGDTETGVSIMRVEPKRFDIGDIFAQRSVSIKPGIFMPQLHKQLAESGAELLWEVVSGYPRSFEKPLKQCEELASYAPKITQDIAEIAWNTMTAADIFRRYRALYGYKTLTSKFNGKTIELLEISIGLEAANVREPGCLEFSRERKCLRVQCAKDTFIEVFRVRVEGKKAMTAVEFNNGFLKKLERTQRAFCCNKNAVSC